MQSGANAYYKTATTTMSPRELEASLLIKAARQLQEVQDDWNARRGDLADALEYNQKLWTVLLSAATNPENPLPPEIRQNVANLGIFILGQILEVAQDPSAAKIKVLVDLNRELAGGLRPAA
jgi:flagellar biosynthesis activator protein FlaF